MQPFQLRKSVFFPVVFIVGCSAIYSLVYPIEFISIVRRINTFFINFLGSIFTFAPLLFLFICLILYIHPVGKTIIGGAEAKPILSKFNWFSITVCTTIATGLLFWGTAEPLFHLQNPPPFYANAAARETFALSALYMHWSFLPYAIYSLAGVAFAIGFYNRKQPFRVGTMWFELNNKRTSKLYNIFDGLSLFSLVAGMSASLGVGILLLTNGVSDALNLEPSNLLMAAISMVIVSTFILSSVSGLQKGIAKLSSINLYLFIILLLGFFFSLDFSAVIPMVQRSLSHFFIHGISDSLLYFTPENRAWAKEWTVFNWSNWMAWTPVTALFLGKIAKGRSIRQFMHVNLFLPAIFGIVWLSIISGTALATNGEANELLHYLGEEDGVANIIFHLLADLPFGKGLNFVFLITLFLSFVTAADSNTDAMSNLSTVGISDENADASSGIKITWGIFIGILAFVMVAYSVTGNSNGLEGVKILSNLGGTFALFILLGAAGNMLFYLFKETKND